jgi:hypothetical protein
MHPKMFGMRAAQAENQCRSFIAGCQSGSFAGHPTLIICEKD